MYQFFRLHNPAEFVIFNFSVFITYFIKYLEYSYELHAEFEIFLVYCPVKNVK